MVPSDTALLVVLSVSLLTFAGMRDEVFLSFGGGLIAAGLVGVKGYPDAFGCFVHLFTKVIHKKPGENRCTT